MRDLVLQSGALRSYIAVRSSFAVVWPCVLKSVHKCVHASDRRCVLLLVMRHERRYCPSLIKAWALCANARGQ